MQESNERIWEQCLNGNRKAFEELYCRFYSLLYNYGIKIIQDKELIKDCIQDLFIKMIQNHQKLSPTLYVKGYLYRAFRNKLFDTFEKQKITDDITLYEERFATDDLFTILFPDNNESEKQSKRLATVFRSLSPHQQEILYLYYINELKHEEIAEIMGINYQSSKNLLFRSLSKLRKLYLSE